MKEVGFTIGWIVVFVFFLFFAPWLFIHAVNGLFDASIPHTLGNFGWFWLLYLLIPGGLKVKS